MQNKKFELIGFSIILVGLSILMFFVFKPFLSIIALAAVLAILFYPLFDAIKRFFWNSGNFSAGFLVVVALIFLIIPVIFWVFQISIQAQNFFSLTQIDQGQFLLRAQQSVNSFVQQIVPTFSFSVSDVFNKVLTFIYTNFSGLLSQTTYIFFQTFLLLFALFFFLRDGEKIFHYLISISPFEKEQNKEIIVSVDRTISSVIRGTLFVGLIRFVFISLAFYAFDIPNAILWGSVGGIVGAIPGIGILFVIVPACIYLFILGKIYSLIGLIISGLLISFFIDNLLSVYFFGKGLAAPSIFVLFSILGGIAYFGPLGFIFGPIILSLFISLIDMYKILVLKKS